MFVFLATIFIQLSWAVLDNCASNCSPQCANDVKIAAVELDGHLKTCRGESPGDVSSECAMSCSPGCKAYMRGQRSIIESHFESCGTGNGKFGQLICELNNHKYYVVNSHTFKVLDSGHALLSQCKESAGTRDYDLFCAQKSQGYRLSSIVDGEAVGVRHSRLSSCLGLIREIKNYKICVEEGTNRYRIYDVDSLQPKEARSFKYLDNCLEQL